MLIAPAGLIPISSSISSANHCPRFRFSSSKQYIPFLVTAGMMRDDPIREWILSEGNATKIKGVRSIGGGCINDASCYDTDAGPFFVKSNSTPQINNWTQDWIDFYAEHRLVYQLRLAREHYADSTIYQKGQKLARNLRLLFQNVVIEPCLLHGDLWSGNIAYDKNGEPVILDPACYYGHNEAEFGMSWCAGFGAAFYNAYFEVMHKQPGFEERKDLYMLYHYLNHYNMFGSGYRSSAMSIIDDYLHMLNL
ncbi:unnamed protein product [Cuscuta epithymum]|uniref:protein-ribulosamine 3-kinase n=1 Tax=Cuscuta epithymum TaxID=186058 RepID=A0AAV0GCX4_9ASTE|nr:unnamed protein product [Cuscuta epithymum]